LVLEKARTLTLSSVSHNVNTEEDEKERQRREQEQMNEEEVKKREKAWRTVKITFWSFGGGFTILGSWLVYELGKGNLFILMSFSIVDFNIGVFIRLMLFLLLLLT